MDEQMTPLTAESAEARSPAGEEATVAPVETQDASLPDGMAVADGAADAPEEPSDDPDWADLTAQAATLQADYPCFNLCAELADARFGTILAALQTAGVPDAVRTAYQCVHHDALMTSALRYAVEHTRQRMADAVRTGAARPVEGGGPGIAAGPDPAHLTPQQIEDVRHRVMMGQRVSF